MSMTKETPRPTVVIHDEEPSEELLEWAKENINEDPDKRDLWISELRDLTYERGECTPRRSDDEFLLRFLRARHFIVKKAHRLLVNYHDFRNSNPEYFKKVDVFRVRQVAKSSIFSIPPYWDQHGRRMFIVRIGSWDPSQYTIPEMFQLVGAVLEIATIEPQVQIKGAVLIVDLSELSLSTAWYMSPTIAKHFVSLSVTCYPIRIEAVHFLYSSWVFDSAWCLIKPLLSDFITERIFFHGDDIETFHSHVDPKCLPKRYGGIHDDYPVDIWLDLLLKNDKFIEEFVNMGYEDVKLLREASKTDDESKINDKRG